MLKRPPDPPEPDERPYPVDWDQVAELRVFRTTAERWQRLLGWRSEMRRKGWKLLRVSAPAGEMVAVFGRTKEELLARQGVAS
jgi:hypothetical protein